MASSHCPNCGTSKTNFQAQFCDDCTNLQTTAVNAHHEANPEAPYSDSIRAGKEALMQRAHNAHRNFIDPRTHSRFNGGGNVIRGR